MAKRYFITATGTDIGKTFASCALIHAARQARQTVSAYKPVISGIDDASPEGSDSAALLGALGQPTNLETLNGISPWRFTHPLAPSMAAQKEGKEFPINALFDWTNNAIIQNKSDLFLMEGVGGVMVPFDAHHTVCDWMMVASLPAILVAGSYLGTMSHTLTALESLEHAGISVRAVIISETPGSTVGLQETADEIRKYILPATSIIALPRLAHYRDAEPVMKELL